MCDYAALKINAGILDGMVLFLLFKKITKPCLIYFFL